MNKTSSAWLAVVAAVAVLPAVGLAQGPDLGTRVLSLKQSLEADQGELRKYEWIETTVVSLKGEEKSRTQNRCYYGADGKLQKVPVSAQQAAMPGGLRGKVAQRKKEELTEYMQKAVAMVHRYVPPDPASLQKLFQSGKTTAQVLEPGRRSRLDFRDYLLPGDLLGVEVDLTNNHILGLQVATYLEKPEDAVNLTVRFAALTNGTGYPAQVTLDAPKEKVRVVTENSGYRPVAR